MYIWDWDCEASYTATIHREWNFGGVKWNAMFTHDVVNRLGRPLNCERVYKRALSISIFNVFYDECKITPNEPNLENKQTRELANQRMNERAWVERTKKGGCGMGSVMEMGIIFMVYLTLDGFLCWSQCVANKPPTPTPHLNTFTIYMYIVQRFLSLHSKDLCPCACALC